MLHVTCAIIKQDNTILICQRSAKMKLPLKWEFPGGKIEQGESKEECLMREIKEELGIDVTLGRELSMVEYHYPEFAICLYPFECTLSGGEPHPTEHAKAIWVDCNELLNYDWAAADLPIVQALMQ
ncbi:(deoxy)nucleoside triphosphate pyrophosphohydrolase [Sphingobacterium pedocola]|uniref:8-oxo-dGTP diphosphatase n=1 Tax=Sphingobacterium pedocola TaxID=2082722 RepID=A0ABR9T7C2_9SPHI|nr:(deoxy)nucleoside triphosphate pyrophosphohydrolase [Sphingobacterium pedocola]MBE8721226.1 DNA mismatch repair protein MutT [Sphingobacterium pedocola]